MMKITDALTVEHVVLSGVFDQIENMLPEITAKEEVARLAQMVNGLLNLHAEVEDNLVYVTLDHALANQGKLNHLHQEHQEIDDHFEKVASAKEVAEAKRSLKKALLASRAHFAGEERFVFPVIEAALQDETLMEMGSAWSQKQKPLKKAS